jgi:hypothetical protein
MALSLIHTLSSLLQYALSLLSLLCPHKWLSGNGFQRRTFPILWVPELSPCLGYQFLTATAHKDWTTADLQLTHKASHSAPLFSLTLTNCPEYNIRSCIHCWRRCYQRGQRREHNFPASLLARVRILLPSNGLCLQSNYLATDLHATV